MRRVWLLLVMLPFLLAATCPGLSQDPTVSKIQSATITCAVITSTIKTLAFMKRAGSLSADQIATTDTLIIVVEPICGVVATSGDLIDLNALEAQLKELQKLTGGSS